jgi:hypothetical protein
MVKKHCIFDLTVIIVMYDKNKFESIIFFAISFWLRHNQDTNKHAEIVNPRGSGAQLALAE